MTERDGRIIDRSAFQSSRASDMVDRLRQAGRTRAPAKDGDQQRGSEPARRAPTDYLAVKGDLQARLLDDLAERHAAGTLREIESSPAPESKRDADVEALLERALTQLDAAHDSDGHGWGRRQKYPIAPLVEHGYARTQWTGDPEPRRRAVAAGYSPTTDCASPR